MDQLFAGKSLWFAAKLHITQAVWCTVNTSLYGSPLYNLLKLCPLIFILIRESPSVFSLTLAAWGRKGSVFSCVFPLSHAHTHSHIKFHCADAEEARFAVSAFPWAKPLCRCPQKRGDENRKLLWSKHLLCYFSRRRSPYGTRARCQSCLRYRWIHFPYQAGLERQTLLAECVPPKMKLRLVSFSSITPWVRMIGPSFMSLLVFREFFLENVFDWVAELFLESKHYQHFYFLLFWSSLPFLKLPDAFGL